MTGDGGGQPVSSAFQDQERCRESWGSGTSMPGGPQVARDQQPARQAGESCRRSCGRGGLARPGVKVSTLTMS